MDDSERNKRIGRRIAEKRRVLGLSQPQFAIAIGSSVQAVSRWERGVQGPMGSIDKIAAGLGCTVEELVNDPADPPASGEVEIETVEVDVPESFRVWRETMAPTMAPLFAPDVEARMLSTGFRYPREDAARWQVIYGEVIAEMRGRRPESHTRAQAEDTARARDALEKSGAMKPPPRKKR